MAKSNIYTMIDVESTMNAHAYDVGIILVNKSGKVLHELACIVENYYNEPLFHNASGFFSKANLYLRTENYRNMLGAGQRVMCSVNHINRFLQKAVLTYGNRLILTAYNLSFDKNICANSGIILPEVRQFCLWHLAVELFTYRESYIKWAIKNKHLTPKLNIITNCEVMSDWIRGYHIKEPHTAYEDLAVHEIPILVYCLRQKKSIKMIKPYNWRNQQLHIAIERLGVKL